MNYINKIFQQVNGFLKQLFPSKRWYVSTAILLIIVFSVFGVGQKVCAQQNQDLSSVPQRAYAAMNWRLVGPFRAGRALAATGVPGHPETYYFGSVDGGVWKTGNAGQTWNNITDNAKIASIGAIAVAHSDPSVIYVGTGESDMRSDMTYGTGVYKSTDGGKHWKFMGLKDTRHIGKIVVNPDNPDIVLVAALGHGYNANKERGVFRSTDGGRTWKKVLYKGPDIGAVDLAMDSQNPSIVFATMWNAHRPAWSQYPPVQGPGSGLYKSVDGGRTWKEIKGNGFPSGKVGRIGVSVVRTTKGERVYALVQSNKKPGLYRSDDGGKIWSLVSQDSRINTRMWYFGRVFADPQNPDIVYIPNRSVMRSKDGGHTFKAIKGSPGGDDYHYVWIDPQNDHHMIIGADQGTTISLDDGNTWSSWYNQPTAQFYHVTTDNAFPFHIYGAQQDAGTVGIASRSDYGEITFRDWFSVEAGESGYLAVDPKNANIIYGGNTYGGIYRFNKKTGQRQDISPVPVSTWPMPPIYNRKYRFTWTSPIVFDPIDKKSLYLGAQVLLRTRDGGHSWKVVSPDLTGYKKGIKSDEKPTVENAAQKGYGVIYSVAPSPIHEGTIWAGTDDGFVWVTTDGGQHWNNVTPDDLKPWSKISFVEASPFKGKTAYIAVDRHRLDDFHPYIYRTEDNGEHWTLINKGIPDGSFVRAVREDPKRPGLLYAGTETGVYVSFDNGDHWQSLQMNLPKASVRDLAVHDNDLIAATHGRAFWVLDDLSPLRQMNQKILDSSLHLYQPATAIRLRRDESHDTPLPPEIPHGKNPPSGAVIDYYFNSKPGGPVRLEILDQKGNVVRTYSSQRTYEVPAGKTYFDREWLPKPVRLPDHAGMNRFVWDLRYNRPKALSYSFSIAAIAGKGTVAEPRGPMVLPGTYTVKLIADGQTKTQNLDVKMDPRVDVGHEALQKQFELSRNIDALLNRTVTTYQNIIKVIKNSDNRLSGSQKVELNEIAQQGDPNLSSLSGALSGLLNGIQTTDDAPTQAQLETYHDLKNKADHFFQKWAHIKSTIH